MSVRDTLEKIAEAIEMRADGPDRETEHALCDQLLLVAIQVLGKDEPAAERIVDAWKRGSEHWWWA